MSSTTSNYNLIKPDYADSADVADLNGNADIIDAALASKQNATDSNLTTTAQTVVGAINELDSEVATNTANITDLQDKVPMAFKMANISLTTTSGVGQITFEQMGIAGKTLHYVMATVNYSSNSGGNLYATCQISSNYINVYLRNGVTSGLASNGTYNVALIYMYS